MNDFFWKTSIVVIVMLTIWWYHVLPTCWTEDHWFMSETKNSLLFLQYMLFNFRCKNLVFFCQFLDFFSGDPQTRIGRYLNQAVRKEISDRLELFARKWSSLRIPNLVNSYQLYFASFRSQVHNFHHHRLICQLLVENFQG